MKIDFENIYEHIGFLHYGVASRSGGLSASSLTRLKDFIEKTWQPETSGYSLTQHLIDSIHEGVRFASENKMSSEHAISSFADFYKMHSLPFSEALKAKIISSLIALTDYFSIGDKEIVRTEFEHLMKN